LRDPFSNHHSNHVEAASRDGKAVFDPQALYGAVQLQRTDTYLKNSNPPQTPRDLLDHPPVAFSYWRPENRWTFVHVNGRDEETVTFQPYLSMNDFAGLTPALLARGLRRERL
jgi:hypothetical protein